MQTLTEQGFTACAPYNGAQWAIGAEGAVCLQEGMRVRIEHKANEARAVRPVCSSGWSAPASACCGSSSTTRAAQTKTLPSLPTRSMPCAISGTDKAKQKHRDPKGHGAFLYGAGNGNRTNKPRSNAVKHQILSSCQCYFYLESCIILCTIQECWKQLCVKKCVTNQPFPSSLRKAALTACAVFSASPVRAWEYWPRVSMFWLWLPAL